MSTDPLRRLDRFFEPHTPAVGVRPSLRFEACGGKEVETPYGHTLILSRAYAWEHLPGQLSWQGVRTDGWRLSTLGTHLPESVPAGSLACLDIETTGLSLGAGTVAFLVGVVHAEPAGVRLTQFLIRDFQEEAAQQQALAEHLSRFDVLCTYNGARFDLPILRSRGIIHRIDTPWLERPHLDLLFPVRSIWRELWPDCRLSTAEFRLLGVVRQGDCEGWEVPLRFRQFLNEPSESLLLDVLEHNAQDLLSLLCLTAVLQRLYGEDTDGFGLTQSELLGLARSLALRGQTEGGLRMYRRAVSQGRLAPEFDRHLRHYVRLLKRQSLWEEARGAWRAVFDGPVVPERYWAFLEEAKYLEHREKLPGPALLASQSAREALLQLPPGPARDRLTALVERRVDRLRKRQKAP